MYRDDEYVIRPYEVPNSLHNVKVRLDLLAIVMRENVTLSQQLVADELVTATKTRRARHQHLQSGNGETSSNDSSPTSSRPVQDSKKPKNFTAENDRQKLALLSRLAMMEAGGSRHESWRQKMIRADEKLISTGCRARFVNFLDRCPTYFSRVI